MTDYTEEWRVITTRWRNGRRRGLIHLLAVPILLYALSIPVKRVAPESWLIRGEPVWYFIVAFALWLVGFVVLLLRDRYYRCPQCGSRVRPFGGTEIANLVPEPCPKCGLRAPPPPY